MIFLHFYHAEGIPQRFYFSSNISVIPPVRLHCPVYKISSLKWYFCFPGPPRQYFRQSFYLKKNWLTKPFPQHFSSIKGLIQGALEAYWWKPMLACLFAYFKSTSWYCQNLFLYLKKVFLALLIRLKID